jgi:hypothetical protein
MLGNGCSSLVTLDNVSRVSCGVTALGLLQFLGVYARARARVCVCVKLRTLLGAILFLTKANNKAK